MVIARGEERDLTQSGIWVSGRPPLLREDRVSDSPVRLMPPTIGDEHPHVAFRCHLLTEMSRYVLHGVAVAWVWIQALARLLDPDPSNQAARMGLDQT